LAPQRSAALIQILSGVRCGAEEQVGASGGFDDRQDCNGVLFASGGAAASACCAPGDRLMESLAESPGASPDFCGAFVLSGADCGERPLGGAVR